MQPATFRYLEPNYAFSSLSPFSNPSVKITIENTDSLFECREQMNFGTAYLDGSGIYGATPESADKLREFKRGFLKVIKSSWPTSTSRKSMKEAKSADFFN